MEEIESRRDKLRNLIDLENELYKNEIKGMEETPDQVRERMFKRVQELKAQKESARKADVEQKLERRFREGADELRKVESEIGELKNMHFRNVQMMEKQELMEQQYQEDMIYAELWKRDIQRKEQREKEEIEERKRRVEERNNVLGWQKETNHARKQDEQSQQENEKNMLRDQWKIEAERLKQQEAMQLEMNKQLNKELFDHNIAQRSIKDEVQRREKIADKIMIDQNVNKEQMLDHLEREAKERQKRETRDFLLNFKNRTNEYHTQEAELERLIKEEMDKQYKRREDQWKKEEDARIKLMYDVYGSMEKDIQLKKDVKQAETVQKEVEKDQVTQDILRLEEELRRKKEEELRNNKQHQSVIVNQMENKRETEKRKLQDQMAQEKADILANLEYMKKVREEKEKGKRMLEELRRQRPY